jgi:glutamine synthetase
MTTKKLEEAREQVLRLTRERDVKFIRLWFSDILGFLKSFSITVEELESVFEQGVGFDGSSIEGFARIEESDMIAMPDPTTFQIIPWRPKEQAVARMFCDILKPGGRPFEGDPRYILKKNLKRAADMGYAFYVGPEMEYFYFRNSSATEPLDYGGYFDLVPPATSDIRRETVLNLELMGIKVEHSHHEVATSQHEIDIRHTEASTMADKVMTYRLVVKQIALQHGVYATFMPKPVSGLNGSGMHVHQSLYKGKQNAFFDKEDRYHLSKIAKCYIAGLMRHAPEITAITSQWVNSYKRLVPGYEAPTYITWGTRNRSALVRIPEYQPGNENALRAEFRSPDPACNPYLAFAAMLAAGLEGIEQKYELPAPVEEDAFRLSEEERKRRNIGSLPASLQQAIELMEGSDLVRKCLGDHIFFGFLRNKKAEWDAYRTQVTEYEIKRYLPVL